MAPNVRLTLLEHWEHFNSCCNFSIACTGPALPNPPEEEKVHRLLPDAGLFDPSFPSTLDTAIHR